MTSRLTAEYSGRGAVGGGGLRASCGPRRTRAPTLLHITSFNVSRGSLNSDVTVVCSPEIWGCQHHHLSTEAASEQDIAKIMSEELDRPIGYEAVDIGDLLSQPRMADAEPAYARCIEQTVTVFRAGILTDIADVTDDAFTVTGVQPTGLREFIRRNLDALAG